MWQLVLAAAVAGSTGLAAKHFLSHKASSVDNANLMLLSSSHESVIESETNSDTRNIPSSSSESRPKKPMIGSKNGIRIPKAELRSLPQVRSEHRNGGKRSMPLSFFKSRKKTINNIPRKPPFCSSKASTLFGWGVSFGIMCMMAGKAEINELTKAIYKTAKVVEELESELNRRKSSRAHQFLDYVGNPGIECCKMSDRDDKIMLKKTKSEQLRDTEIKFWSLAVNDNGECESSDLTDVSDPLILEMDQLEAELEFELQKLPGNTIDTNCHEEIKPKLEEVKIQNEGCDGTDNWNFNSSQYLGVSASELNQKLCQLLIEQRENQIADLESELNLAQSKLHEKEAELQALKNCVKLLTELPLSTDDETEAHKGTSNWDSNIVISESKQSVGGEKRTTDSESCAYHPKSDIDLHRHTKYKQHVT